MVPPLEVTEQIDASPDRVWRVIADPTAMGDLTVECVAMRWIGSASGPGEGARFRGQNRSGWRRWSTTCTIVRYQPDVEIAWEVRAGPLRVARWGYRIESDGPLGSALSERFEDRRGRLLSTLGPLLRGTGDAEALNRRNMVTTLNRIKARAESS